MDEKFVQGVVGGVLNRHKDQTLDEKRIQTLMVEIAANINLFSSAKGLAKDNPLSIEMWKGWKEEKEYEVELQKKSDKIMKRLDSEPITIGKSNESSGPRWDYWGKPGRGWIYETPDKGHTIYKRRTGSSIKTRELVQEQLELFKEE